MDSTGATNVFICEHSYAHVYQSRHICCGCVDGVCPAVAHQRAMQNLGTYDNKNEYTQFAQLNSDSRFLKASTAVKRKGDIDSTFLCALVLYIENDIAFIQSAIYYRDHQGPGLEVARVNVRKNSSDGIHHAARTAFLYAFEELVSSASRDYDAMYSEARYEISCWDFTEPLVFILDRTEFL